MGGELNAGALLPTSLLYLATLLAIAILIYPFYRARSLIARYALFALCFRYLAAAHHTFTFQPSFLGMSWNALGSSAVFLMGLFLVRLRHFLLKALIPFYAVIAVILMSGAVNHDLPDTIDVIVKYGYLAIITISVYEAMDQWGEQRTLNLLLWAFVTPLLLQALSIAFGVAKAGEADGSRSFIGGYSHEASFSIIAATCFVIACFASNLKVWIRGLILFACIASIVLANYRTAIFAFAPLAFVQFNLDVINRFAPRQRIIIGVGIGIVSGIGAIVAAWLMRERFQDLVILWESAGNLFKPPDQYTAEERILLSTRPFIWSGYITAYLEGGPKNLLLGFGPDSWIGTFAVYAHNTLVSTLYEYGLLGVLAMCYLWGAMFIGTLRIKKGPRGKLIAAHLGFFLLNMATMPHWMLEGDILYGVICGYTFYLMLGPSRLRKPQPLPVGAAAGPRVLQPDLTKIGGRRPSFR